jgi:molybdenum cofactor cytidylyltransferase
LQNVAAILLSAGQSQRMGAFKPLLPFGDSTVIEASINYLRQGGIENIVVVLGHRAAEVQQHLGGQALTFALNPDPNSEMGASIGAGVSALPMSVAATLIALVDQPAIPATVVTKVLAEWTSGSSLVVPTWHERGGHPVLVNLGFREQLCDLDPQGGLKSLFRDNQSRVSRIAVDSPYIARDMDTWDDYLRLHEEVFGGPPRAMQNKSNANPGGLI